MTVFSTVGFGDITPKTEVAQLVTTVQMLVDLVVVVRGGSPDPDYCFTRTRSAVDARSLDKGA